MRGLFLLAMYVLPAVIAMWRHHRQAGPIAVVNLFFGWTVIGWIIPLAWSLSDKTAARPAVRPRP